MKSNDDFNPKNIDYGEIINWKKEVLITAYENFKERKRYFNSDFDAYCKNNKEWLDDYSLFHGCKRLSRR
ncbi:MAG: 4-alpha-glucanotransferase [Melioribacteraceae bacterium]|nr:4-alpha-glucanotransferase [Melioribacteraceae bacterium]